MSILSHKLDNLAAQSIMLGVALATLGEHPYSADNNVENRIDEWDQKDSIETL